MCPILKNANFAFVYSGHSEASKLLRDRLYRSKASPACLAAMGNVPPEFPFDVSDVHARARKMAQKAYQKAQEEYEQQQGMQQVAQQAASESISQSERSQASQQNAATTAAAPVAVSPAAQEVSPGFYFLLETFP